MLTPKVPATTTPPTPAKTYFVELILRQHGAVVDRNVYWLSTQQDVIDWNTTEGNPQADNGAPLSQYADMTALQKLPSEPVQVTADTVPQPGPDGDNVTTNVTITNPSSNSAVAFFLRADVRRGNADGTAQSGDNEVLPITWSDNDITLWPGESETLTANYRSSLLHGADPVVSVYGWNVPTRCSPPRRARRRPRRVHAAATHAAGPALRHCRRHAAAHRYRQAPGVGQMPGTGASRGRRWTRPASHRCRPGRSPRWRTRRTPRRRPASPRATRADTYTLTVTNTGNAPTDGTTPVTLTDIVDPNISMTSISGTGWTCDTSNDPTEVCTETWRLGRRARPYCKPGQSYPPITLTVQVPLGTGFGNQDSTDGLHVTNGVIVTGGAASQPSTSLASPTPIVGRARPDRRQRRRRRVPSGRDRPVRDHRAEHGRRADQRQQLPTRSPRRSPGMPTGVIDPGAVRQRLDLQPRPRSPRREAEPADTCYRSDVLAGENGEDPPITVVASVANNAAGIGKRDGPGRRRRQRRRPRVGRAATTIQQAADLNAASSHTGSFVQGDSRRHLHADGRRTSTARTRRRPADPSLGLVSVTDSLPWGLTATGMSGPGWTCRVGRADLLPHRHAGGGLFLPAGHADGECRRQRPGVGDQLGDGLRWRHDVRR